MTTGSENVSAPAATSTDKAELLAYLMAEEGLDLPQLETIHPRSQPRDHVPLSFAQQRLWFLDQLNPQQSAYNIPLCFDLRGSLDRPALAQSLNAIVQRHEALRTIFPTIDSQPVQQIAPTPEISLPLLDLRSLPNHIRQTELERLTLAEAQEPFDLSTGPLLRTKLLRLAESEHRLLLTVHHLIFDARSMEIFARELSHLYPAFAAGQPVTLPKPEIQYADYAMWEQEWLQGERLERQLAYWRKQLAGLTPLTLPVAQPRPKSQTYAGARQPLALSPQLTARLKTLSQQTGTTLFMTMLAAFKLLLHRYSGQTDLAIGTPVANRTRPETEDVVGFFTNTLVLRTDLSGNPSFKALLSRVRQVAVQAYGHQDIPFEKLVETIQPARTPNRHPLFQVMFILQNDAPPAPTLPGVQLQPLDIDNRTAKFDLTLSLADGPQGLAGYIEYNTDLFAPDTIQRLAGQFETLLKAVATEPDMPVGHVPLLPTAERCRLLLEWNDTRTGQPISPAIHRLFEIQADLTPTAPAITFPADRRELSYRTLNEQANQLARYLKKQGVTPNRPVALYFERSPEMLVGLLAVLKAGSAYLPLDPTYPPKRLAFMLADAGVSVLLTHNQTESSLPAHSGQVINLGADWPTIARESPQNLDLTVAPESLLYLIYTSGSTGQPKGVALPHRALVNLITWQLAQTTLQTGARTLQFTSLSFDVSAQEIFTALCSGGTLVLIPETTRQDPATLAQVIAGQRIERLFLPFVALQQLAQTLDAQPSLHLPLKEIITAGEQLRITPAIINLFTRLPDCTLHNQYGPTESHVVTAFSLSGRPQRWPTLPPIGRPIANTQIYLLDSHRQPVPIGVPGELYIGGANLARGYINRPALTEARFIAHPFSSRPGARLYKTGDLARYRPDGNIEFLGRVDHQLKIRGYRLEPGEVEAALEQHPAIREAVVVAHRDKTETQQLVAYLVPAAGQTPPPAQQLRHHLQQQLPDYMIPALFMPLDSLPLTPSGKIDRQALPAPHPAPRPPGEAAVPPRNPVEELLAGIWHDVFSLESISIHDNFFEIGGHSLLAVQVVSRIKALFQIALPVQALFEAPTIARLAQRVEAARSDRPAQSLPPVTPLQADRPAPLSFAQQRLWFLHQLEPALSVFNIPVAFRVSGSLDQTALQQSLAQLVRRHQALHTVFLAIQGRPVQRVNPDIRPKFTVVDLSQLAPAQRKAEAKKRGAAAARRPFDLANGPLLRLLLLRLSDTDHILLLTIHHIISDGWSMRLLFQELSRLYRARVAQTRPNLPALPVQYPDFARWQRQCWQEGRLDTQLNYWQQQLKHAPPPLELPTDRPRPAIQTYQGAQQSLELGPELTQALKNLSREQGTTLFMLLLAAFKVLLYRHTGRRDLMIGIPAANRNRPETEGVIGYFVNSLVLRTNLAGNPPFTELLARVRAVALAAYEHQDLPFEKLIDRLQPERDLSRTPLFQVFFNMLNVAPPILDLSHTTTEPFSPVEPQAKFDLTLYAFEQKERLHLSFVYNQALFQTETIAALLQQFQTLLAAIVAGPAQRLSELPLVRPQLETQHLPQLPEPANRPFPRPDIASSIPARVEQMVRQYPHRVAVNTNASSLTYYQLNAAANQVARTLLARRGPQPEQVALLFEQDASMLVGLLGTLKAGKTYVPLDPAHPQARLAYILQDAQAALILTHTPHRQLAQTLAQAKIEHLNLDTIDPATPTENISRPVPPEALAYLLYTSGSTGQPKGVMQNHRNVLHHIGVYSNRLGLTANDRLTLLSTYSFDAAVMDIFGALLNGASLYPINLKAERVEAIARRLAGQKITVFHATPTVYRYLVDSLSPEQSFPTVRWLVLGGEEVYRADVERYKQHFPPPCMLVNGLGPTESTLALQYFVDHQTNLSRDSVPVGWPVEETELLLLDEAGHPTGAYGEIALKSPYLALGYWQKPDLTAAAFRPDPQGGRLYATGDMGRLLPDGTLEFAGRKDFQLKIRGFRVELREVEAVLRQHPAVKAVAVVATGPSQQAQQLVACLVWQPGQTATLDTLHRFVGERLPDYMRPAKFVTLPALPLTPTGKIDRAALPPPDVWPASATERQVAPRNPLELSLLKIWESLLETESIGIHDNFFERGGHSLLAVRMLAQIETQIGASLPLATIFQAPTVARLAQHIEAGQSQNVAPWRSLVPLRAGGTRPPFFCVPGNLGNVYVDLGDLTRQLDPDQPVYGLQDSPQNPAQIEAQAAYYLAEIQTVQPKGPYLLGGICAGSVVAYEMAQQLWAQGQNVALLALIEPVPAPRPDWRNYARLLHGLAKRVTGRLWHHSTRLRQQSRPEQQAYTRLKIKLMANSWAAARYAPQPYPGRVMLIFGQDSFAGNQDPRLNWRMLATGGSDVRLVPGTHNAITRTHNATPTPDEVRKLAQQLAASIERALGGSQ